MSETPEVGQASFLSDQLRTPVRQRAGYAVTDYQNGGYGAKGSGVSPDAAIDGSHAFLGNQGYYTADGKEQFRKSVASLKGFFARHQRGGTPIRLVIKAGIGGQHTPFQGIADVFAEIGPKGMRLIGEYELGKDIWVAVQGYLKEFGITHDQLAIIASSKSGSTDETMMIFADLLHTAIRLHTGEPDGARVAHVFFDVLHRLNFLDEKERPGHELFLPPPEKDVIDLFVGALAAEGFPYTRQRVVEILKKSLGRMVFETTDNAAQSRLAAFIRNSGFDKALGDDRPVFIEMYENVGGRWTGDLHMMSALAFYDLDADAYWQRRYQGIQAVRSGAHEGNRLGHRICDERLTDIALIVPDMLLWFGKSIEQNFNESIWQPGFANLIAIPETLWPGQKKHYKTNSRTLVINLSSTTVDSNEYTVVTPPVGSQIAQLSSKGFLGLFGGGLKGSTSDWAAIFADLWTTFYGMTHTVGTRLIARKVKESGQTIHDLDLSNLDLPVTRTVLEALFLRQPFVELGKKFLETRMKAFEGAVSRLEEGLAKIQEAAKAYTVQTNIPGDAFPESDLNAKLSHVAQEVCRAAYAEGRKLVPFLYLEGQAFVSLRRHLTVQGIPWVMQGTGDQHISYQQVLAQPQRYLPVLISFVPLKESPETLVGRAKKAIGFAKGYLNKAPSHLVRDYFAEASYQALLQQGGKGVFIRLPDEAASYKAVQKAFDRPINW